MEPGSWAKRGLLYRAEHAPPAESAAGRRPRDWPAAGAWLGKIPAATLPHVRLDWGAIIQGAVVLALLAGLAHGLACASCHGASREPDVPGLRWRLRWTLCLLAAVVLMFAVGLAAMGVARQLGWLLGR